MRIACAFELVVAVKNELSLITITVMPLDGFTGERFKLLLCFHPSSCGIFVEYLV